MGKFHLDVLGYINFAQKENCLLSCLVIAVYVYKKKTIFCVQLFSGVFVEDPLFACELAQHLVAQQDEQSGARRSHKERQLSILQSVGRVMEVLMILFTTLLIYELLFMIFLKVYFKH